MPSCNRLDKSIGTPGEQRLQMLDVVWNTAFRASPRLLVSDLELQLGPPTQLRRTLLQLGAIYPDTEFWFAYGGDAYQDMPNWPGAREFMRDIHTVVFTEHELPGLDGERVVRLHLPPAMHDMSSSHVRAAVARGQDTSAWLSEPVRQYIDERGLYR